MDFVTTKLADSWALAQAHPLMALLGGMTVLNLVALRVVATQPPTSRLYHLAKLVLSAISDGLGILNALRGIAGKPAVALGAQPPVGLQAVKGPP